MKPALLYVSAMTPDDLPGVWAIEQTLAGPWTIGQLKDELALPHGWRFVISPLPARPADKPAGQRQPMQPRTVPEPRPILGYIFGATVLDEAEIRKLAVAPACRRQGIASLLLTEIDLFLAASSVKECFLELRAANAAALALYQKNGFQIAGQRKNYYTLPADDAILAKKQYPFVTALD